MEYEEIKTPRQLLEFMYQNIQYGFVDDEGRVYGSFDMQAFQIGCKTKWRLSSTERLLQVGYGHCFDVTEFERTWFLEHGYEVKTMFITFDCPYKVNFTCHAYLLFHKMNHYCYFDYKRGIYPFSSYEEAILFQKELHIEHNKQQKVSKKDIQYIKIYEYPTPPFNCTDDEFKMHIKLHGKEIMLPKEKTYSLK